MSFIIFCTIINLISCKLGCCAKKELRRVIEVKMNNWKLNISRVVISSQLVPQKELKEFRYRAMGNATSVNCKEVSYSNGSDSTRTYSLDLSRTSICVSDEKIWLLSWTRISGFGPLSNVVLNSVLCLSLGFASNSCIFSSIFILGFVLWLLFNLGLKWWC